VIKNRSFLYRMSWTDTKNIIFSVNCLCQSVQKLIFNKKTSEPTVMTSPVDPERREVDCRRLLPVPWPRWGHALPPWSYAVGGRRGGTYGVAAHRRSSTQLTSPLKKGCRLMATTLSRRAGSLAADEMEGSLGNSSARATRCWVASPRCRSPLERRGAAQQLERPPLHRDAIASLPRRRSTT
jgi:hypothetical protein